MGIDSFLSSVRGFRSMDVASLQRISENSTVARFAAGARIIERGAPGDTMHIIQAGEVRIPILDAQGQQKLVVHMGPGDLVGEMALLTGEPRSADVLASTDVQTVVIDRGTLQPLLYDNPQLARFLTEILAQRLSAGGGIEAVGKYRLLGLLGEGATAKVYEAVHPGLNRVVAIKMLGHALVYDRKFLERFINEARTIAGLTHPNIVQIFDTESGYGTYFIIMEKIDGSDLNELLDKRQNLSPEETMDILKEVGHGLKFAHEQGVVHRDVKPANVALSNDGAVKIMDFGIAGRIPKGDERKKRSVVEGTPRYLSPEAAIGEEVDGRADIYAMGVMAYEMLTGEVPFNHRNVTRILEAHVYDKVPDIRKTRRDLPEPLIDFIKGTMIKQPRKRLADWDQIFSMLDTSPPPAAELWSQQAEERLVRIRYLPGQASRVDAAVEQLEASLDTQSEIDVATVQLRGAAGDAKRSPRSNSWLKKLAPRQV